VGRRLNESELGKRIGMGWTRIGARPALHAFISNRLELRGQEHLPKRSFILVCNHRTWFDLYATTIAFWPLYDEVPFLYCPVRSNYYYERPMGVALNLAVSGNAMYPPIFRDDRGPALNRLAVESCTRLLDWSPRTIIGIHPEGTRNSSEDPYSLLPAKPGVGYIAHDSKAPVIPAFVAGLPRKFGRIARDRFRKDAEPVRVWLGPPVPLDDLLAAPADRETAHAIADRSMEGVRALAEQDRAYMAARG
jgi:1-acyl-sn-glycerol-3-phosphate acyltransferase